LHRGIFSYWEKKKKKKKKKREKKGRKKKKKDARTEEEEPRTSDNWGKPVSVTLNTLGFVEAIGFL